MKLTKEKAIDILDEDNDEFSIVVNKLSGSSRWCKEYTLVIKENSSGRFYKSGYRVGATESQDEGPWEYDNEVEFKEVFPVEKTIVVYE